MTLLPVVSLTLQQQVRPSSLQLGSRLISILDLVGMIILKIPSSARLADTALYW
jgi:hypothetical protein